MSHLESGRRGALTALFLSAAVVLAACRGYAPVSPVSVALDILSSSPPAASQAAPAAAPEPAATPAAAAPAAVAETVAEAGAVTVTAAIPTELSIPDIGLDAPVTSMGWELAMNGDAVTTRWVVPLDTLGWAVNSAEAGMPGNTVIAGHQALGAGWFRPLALGEVIVGQEIRLQASDGSTYLYRVGEVSQPIPAIGANAQEVERSAAYLAPTQSARLTLVSGWPADTTTHRVFVVADYVGKAP